MNQENLHKKLIEAVKDKYKKFKTPIEFFIRLKDFSFTRLEIMIIDSVVKGIPMDNLHNTLLLPKEKYLEIIDNLSNKLNKLKF